MAEPLFSFFLSSSLIMNLHSADNAQTALAFAVEQNLESKCTDKLEAADEEKRKTEDDKAREHLGPQGVPVT